LPDSWSTVDFHPRVLQCLHRPEEALFARNPKTHSVGWTDLARVFIRGPLVFSRPWRGPFVFPKNDVSRLFGTIGPGTGFQPGQRLAGKRDDQKLPLGERPVFSAFQTAPKRQLCAALLTGRPAEQGNSPGAGIHARHREGLSVATVRKDRRDRSLSMLANVHSAVNRNGPLRRAFPAGREFFFFCLCAAGFFTPRLNRNHTLHLRSRPWLP